MTPADLLLSKLEPFGLRQNGADRWRCRCPAHGGGNPQTLSLGIADTGAVLLTCWAGCSIEAVTAALGLAVADLFPPRLVAGGPLKRRHLVTASQALAVLDGEANLIAVTAGNIASGVPITDADRERVLQAAGRITRIREEFGS
jgi:hypothetical protein